MKKTCGNCFHRFVPEIGQHACNRYPPTLAIVPIQNSLGQVKPQAMAQFPPVNLEMTCGEWDPKESDVVVN